VIVGGTKVVKGKGEGKKGAHSGSVTERSKPMLIVQRTRQTEFAEVSRGKQARGRRKNAAKPLPSGVGSTATEKRDVRKKRIEEGEPSWKVRPRKGGKGGIVAGRSVPVRYQKRRVKATCVRAGGGAHLLQRGRREGRGQRPIRREGRPPRNA